MVIIMSVLGAVVMPHNLFLHSEVIQSRQWNLTDDAMIRRQLRYEYADTILSMLDRLGDQQRDDPARGRDVLRLADSGFGSCSRPTRCCVRCSEVNATVDLRRGAAVWPGSPRRSRRAWPPVTIFAGMFRGALRQEGPATRGFGVDASRSSARFRRSFIVISDPFQGLIYSADGAQHSAPVHRFPAGSPDFLGEGDGKIPQFALDQVVALRRRRSRDMAERHAVR